jgi:hypothetical protein
MTTPTHPDIVTLVDPLFGFAGKRAGGFLSFCPYSIFEIPSFHRR